MMDMPQTLILMDINAGFFYVNGGSIFEINVDFESIFENFVISKKMSMVHEVTISIAFSSPALTLTLCACPVPP